MSASYDILKLAPLNPILLRVVTAGGRRLRHAFTRWGYLALLVLVLLVTQLASSTAPGESSLSDYAKSSSSVFAYISYVQLGMICLLAPVFCAAAITQERDSRTYNILLATPLTNAQIVLGSLFSRLYYVVALLLSGVPVFAITLLYGGVTASSIALSFAIALSTAFFTGSLAIAIAVFRLGSGKTVFWFYVFNAIYLVALLFVDQMWLSVDASGNHHTTWLTSIHPFLALRAVVSPTAYPTPDPGSLADLNRFARWYYAYPAYAYITLTTTASLAMVIPSAIVLRRIAQRSEVGLWSYLGNLLRQGKEGKSRRARNVWSNPVAWREAATRAGFSGRGLIRWITIFVGLAGAFALLYVHYRGFRTATAEPIAFSRQLLLGLIIVEFSVALLVATNTSASAVTKERESQTLDLLLVTPITSKYYIWGKLRGLVSFMLPFAAVPTVTVLLVVLYDFVAGLHFAGSGQAILGSDGLPVAKTFWERAFHNEWVANWETILSRPIILTAVLAWACMLGLQLSLKWSRTIVAVMASVGVLAGICAVLGVCGFTMALQVPYVGPPLSLASPFTAICVLIDPGNFSSDFHNGPYMHDPSSTDHGSEYFGRALLFFMTLAVSAGYCLLVWWMYKSMVKNFDMIIRRQHQ
ncbi:MAG TPA: ABC transporter permease subunit [Phycisphaerae bacterium]|nr:ABC transporter permease subunit [Phycisphaerae bacterium]